MAKMSKAECSKAGTALSKNGSSAAGKKLAQCRWGTKAKTNTRKPKAAPKAAIAARKSRRLAGQGPVRGPEPPAKPRKKAKKKAGGQSSADLKKIENRLVPGLNPPKGDMAAYIRAQQRQYA